MKSLRADAAGIILWLVCMFCGASGGAHAGEPEKLNICYSSIAATSITTWVPHEAGIYKKYGLDVGIIYVAGSFKSLNSFKIPGNQTVQMKGSLS